MTKYKLFVISFASLYFELLFIRWIPDSIHVLSFFGNFTLLAIFLGLGIGLGATKIEEEENLFGKIVLNIVIFSGAILFFDLFRFKVNYFGEVVFGSGTELFGLQINFYLIIFLFLVLPIFCFVPIGKMVKAFFSTQKPLVAYSLNILGSLSGIIFFTFLSYLGSPLWFWMLCGLLLILPLTRHKAKYTLLFIVFCAVILGENSFNEERFGFKKFWSPYYCLQFKQVNKDHCYITIGSSFLLSGLNLLLENEKVREYYEFPYLLKKEPENVLVLGAGMGNDVAVGLKNGAKHIDAVEIDPIIVELGKKFHPLKPYNDPRVTVIVNDARAYTKNCKKKYDLIVFGTLDSHGLFSLFSSIKLENYVYTLESFQEVKELLAKDGLVYVNTGFMGVFFVNYRIFRCLSEVFKKEPLLFIFQGSILMYLTGNIENFDQKKIEDRSYKKLSLDHEKAKKEFPGSLVLPTDDWPHLYLKEKMIPREYGFALLILFVVSAGFIFLFMGKAKSLSPFYFFLGAGFMLLETKSITEMGLIFGSTWIVTSVVISSILLIILLVNLFLLKFKFFENTKIVYFGLGVSLIFGYFFPLKFLGQENFALKLILSVLYVSIPIFFSSLIFGLSFRKEEKETSLCLASNMLGAIIGGIVEYGSMIFGLKSLGIFAFSIYFLSYLFPRRN